VASRIFFGGGGWEKILAEPAKPNSFSAAAAAAAAKHLTLLLACSKFSYDWRQERNPTNATPYPG
jgi:hypothetical protein